MVMSLHRHVFEDPRWPWGMTFNGQTGLAFSHEGAKGIAHSRLALYGPALVASLTPRLHLYRRPSSASFIAVYRWCAIVNSCAAEVGGCVQIGVLAGATYLYGRAVGQ